MNPSINDELVNKVFHLTKALNQAKDIINILEKQNICLKDALNNLASTNKEDYSHCLEYNAESITGAV